MSQVASLTQKSLGLRLTLLALFAWKRLAAITQLFEDCDSPFKPRHPFFRFIKHPFSVGNSFIPNTYSFFYL